MPVSKAQQKAVAKYNLANYDRIEIKVEKGQKEVIREFAANRGESLNAFICGLIEKEMTAQEDNRS